MSAPSSTHLPLGGNFFLPSGTAACNCVIRTTDGGAFLGHRAFLRTVSPFFEALFRGEHGATNDVLLSHITKPILSALLTFYYTDNISITNENVVELLEAADMLLMEAARQRCLRYLLQSMGVDNCLSLAALAQTYAHCVAFRNAVMPFTHENFAKFWPRSKELPLTPLPVLHAIISSDDLNLRREENLLYAIHRWYSHKRHSVTAIELSSLLQCVRIGLLQETSLQALQKRCSAFVNTPTFQDTIGIGLKRSPCTCSSTNINTGTEDTHESYAPDRDPSSHNPTANPDPTLPIKNSLPMVSPLCGECGNLRAKLCRPRTPYELILMPGGISNGRTSDRMEAYNPRSKCWTSIPHKGFQKRNSHGTVWHGGRVYVVGGFGLMGSCSRSVFSFDPETGVWERCSPLNSGRAYFSVCALGEYVYAIGGSTGASYTSTVERYHARSNQWINVSSMKKKRGCPSACVFKGKIYVSGGFNSRQYLRSVEMYTPSLDTWTVLFSLPTARSSHGMVAVGNHIYVIGGRDSRKRFNTVVRCSPDFYQGWTTMAPMKTPRSSFAMALLEGDLYVIGGIEENGVSTAQVEHFSFSTNMWFQATPLERPSYCSCACTVKGVQATRRLICAETEDN